MLSQLVACKYLQIQSFFSFAFLNCHTHDEQLTSNVQVLYISIPSKNKNIDGVQQKLNVPLFIRHSDFTFAVGVKLLNSKYIKVCLENQGFQRRY